MKIAHQEERFSRSPLTFKPEDVVTEPFPHIIKQPAIEPELFQRLLDDFPGDSVFDRNTKLGGRTGRDLYRGDHAYEELIFSSPAWKEFNEYVHSQAYVDQILELFREQLPRFGCYTDPERARFVDHVEGREELANRSRLRQEFDNFVLRHRKPRQANDVFVRLDLSQGEVGYSKPVHCDRPNRLTTMLVYFSDAEEIEMEGGELLVHEHREEKPPRKYTRHPHPHDTREIARISARRNLGVLLLDTNNSYHSVLPIRAQERHRNFIYCCSAGIGPKLWPLVR